MSVLVLNNIEKSFDGIHVLRGISLTFAPGTVTALLGDNGAGKSTLLKIIAGVTQPDKGELKLGESYLTNLDVGERRRIGLEMVYQDLALARQQDVVHNLFLGRELSKPLWRLDRDRMRVAAMERLAELGISIPDLTQRVGKLSGGQQQAIAIARALLFDPKVLLLDEPTAALGAREVEHVIDLIRRAKAEGRAIIFVSHRFNDVFAVADRIVVLKQGLVYSDQPASETSIPQVIEKIVN